MNRIAVNRIAVNQVAVNRITVPFAVALFALFALSVLSSSCSSSDAEGTAGGPCRLGAYACDPGLVCSFGECVAETDDVEPNVALVMNHDVAVRFIPSKRELTPDGLDAIDVHLIVTRVSTGEPIEGDILVGTSPPNSATADPPRVTLVGGSGDATLRACNAGPQTCPAGFRVQVALADRPTTTVGLSPRIDYLGISTGWSRTIGNPRATPPTDPNSGADPGSGPDPDVPVDCSSDKGRLVELLARGPEPAECSGTNSASTHYVDTSFEGVDSVIDFGPGGYGVALPSSTEVLYLRPGQGQGLELSFQIHMPASPEDQRVPLLGEYVLCEDDALRSQLIEAIQVYFNAAGSACGARAWFGIFTVEREPGTELGYFVTWRLMCRPLSGDLFISGCASVMSQ